MSTSVTDDDRAAEKAHKDQMAAIRMRRTVELLGECLTDLGRVLVQGIRDDNAAARGSIAAGLERAAAYMRNESYEPMIAPGFEKKGT